MELKSLTDAGVKVYDNQDNYWAARLLIDGEEVGVICLCDGMGGLDNGALASKIVVSEVKKYLINTADTKSIESIILRANRELFKLSSAKGIKSGTTCTLVICRGGNYEIYHVGDSRCYHMNSALNSVSILTEDHTVIAKYEKEGKILPENLKRKYKNTLVRCVGVSESVVVDYIKGTYNSGDMFLVCSDGFWHSLEVGHFFDGSLDRLDLLAKKFISLGETDNITAVWIKV